jgi:hypothetical protein
MLIYNFDHKGIKENHFFVKKTLVNFIQFIRTNYKSRNKYLFIMCFIISFIASIIARMI